MFLCMYICARRVRCNYVQCTHVHVCAFATPYVSLSRALSRHDHAGTSLSYSRSVSQTPASAAASLAIDPPRARTCTWPHGHCMKCVYCTYMRVTKLRRQCSGRIRTRLQQERSRVVAKGAGGICSRPRPTASPAFESSRVRSSGGEFEAPAGSACYDFEPYVAFIDMRSWPPCYRIRAGLSNNAARVHVHARGFAVTYA